MKVYIGGSTRTASQREFSEKIDKVAKEIGLQTFLPHRDVKVPGKKGEQRGLLTKKEDYLSTELRKSIFEQNIKPLNECDVAIMTLDGLCWGTTVELGYAYALKTKCRKNLLIIGIYTDPLGLEMLDFIRYESCDVVVSSLEEMKDVLTKVAKRGRWSQI